MAKPIHCPSCGDWTEVPSYPGDRVSATCGCPTGRRLARGELSADILHLETVDDALAMAEEVEHHEDEAILDEEGEDNG